MITDGDTDTVYFADLLAGWYPDFTGHLLSVLGREGIATGVIPGTRDVWCRDFMPIQVDVGRFVHFLYAPSYLQSGDEHLITSPDIARAALNGAPCVTSSIALDGGNVVGWAGHVIITDRVYSENPERPPKSVCAELMELLEAERLTVIPAEPDDVLGHADGVVRFLDAGTVVVNDYRRTDPRYRRRLMACLRRAGLGWVELPFCPVEQWDGDIPPATGVYVNFLRVRGLLAIPQFGLPMDEEVLRVLEKVVRGVAIVPVPCSSLAIEGGVLNSVSWTIATARPNVLDT